ncbi:aminoacyl-tRNA deacylase [Pelistega europaea]|uniref:Cys-tRNA(Pro)/Cys-tRNA(Cys) deacylase n=1 Tax=Pelistega europaea TaxID=106147 RepID=A0A7Y4L9T6_9BURK|nr:aminoacyl-tRNA deacylase [Pelistega europaea]NOL49523.1 aminoacyl-tRNA deacylase [Pelistega europaea]
MSKAKHVSETPATQFLKKNKVIYEEHTYDYVEHGGTAETSKQLGVGEHQIVKTLIFEDDSGKPHVVLMHGDCEVSAKNLARQVGVKKMQIVAATEAPKHSGYQIGGTSPFGTRKHMPVWIEKTILDYDKIYINGGRRGYILSLNPQVIVDLLGAKAVEVANEHGA